MLVLCLCVLCVCVCVAFLFVVVARGSVWGFYSIPFHDPNPQVELVADSLEGMERLLEALGKSKSKSKRDDVQLRDNLAEVRYVYISMYVYIL